MSRFLLFSCLFFGFWLFLGQHHHLIDKSGNPLFRERETLVVLADIEHHLDNSCILVVVLGKDFLHGLLGHRVDGALEERRHTQLELHEITHQHHQVLGKALELYEVHLYVLYLTAVLTNTGINLFEEEVVNLVELFEHLLAVALLTNTQLIVLGGHMQRRLEHTQVGQHGWLAIDA